MRYTQKPWTAPSAYQSTIANRPQRIAHRCPGMIARLQTTPTAAHPSSSRPSATAMPRPALKTTEDTTRIKKCPLGGARHNIIPAEPTNSATKPTTVSHAILQCGVRPVVEAGAGSLMFWYSSMPLRRKAPLQRDRRATHQLIPPGNGTKPTRETPNVLLPVPERVVPSTHRTIFARAGLAPGDWIPQVMVCPHDAYPKDLPLSLPLVQTA